MKPTELRIGNYISFIDRTGKVHIPQTHPLKIFNVDIFKIKACQIFENFAQVANMINLDVRDLTGIPLTEEWLLKFGFIISRDFGGSLLSPEYARGSRLRILPTVNKKTFLWQINEFNNVKIKYVHQLQNLYFALTQKELTIKK